MPYIKKEDRQGLDPYIDALVKIFDKDDRHISPGEFNYIVSKLLWNLWQQKPNYTNANSLIGALECVKQEFYRRHVAPYEDQKISKNGDVT